MFLFDLGGEGEGACFSLGAETRTPKNSPHKCLIQILIT